MQQKDDKIVDRYKLPLKRVLGLFTAVLLVAGLMIGSGVFKKIIPMSQSGLSEAWILGAWAIAGIITMFGAFTISGLSSLTEESGGVYEYLRLSFGNFFSFIFGWTDFAILGAASIAAIGYVFSQTVNSIIPLPNPFQSLEHISIAHFIYPFANSGIKILTMLVIFFLTWVNYRGVKNGGLVNNIITSAKIIGILFLIVFGLLYAAPAAPVSAEIITVNTGTELKGTLFFNALFAAMLSAFWAYDGWSNITFVTGEIKNPKRNIPIAIILGVAIAMTLYLLINHAYMHVLSIPQLAAVNQNNIGAVLVAETIFGTMGKTLVIVLIMVSVFGTLNAIIMSHSRVYFRMARENYFFKRFSKVHPTYRTPYVSLFYTMLWSCVLVISGTFDILTDMVIFAGFLFYGLLGVALFKMKRNGSIKVKVIGYPIVPVVLMLFSTALIINTFMVQPAYSITGVGLVLIGVPVYYYFKMKENKL